MGAGSRIGCAVYKWTGRIKMNPTSISRDLSTCPLPQPLAEALMHQPPGLRKRERTRRHLLSAALRVVSVRGVAGCTLQEIAEVAGVTPGTVYNHFDSRDDVVAAVGVWLAETLSRRIADTQVGVAEGAERMAIGQRRYVWLAEQSPAWALLLLDVVNSAPHLLGEIAKYVRGDLELAIAQRAFRVTDEAAAIDLCMGSAARAMLTVALGLAKPGHGTAVTTMLLRGLGMDFERAAQVASRPLPPFPPLGTEVPAAPATRAKAAATRTPRGSKPAGLPKPVAPTRPARRAVRDRP
jgi:AcrR family transcriptional regulator